MKLESSTRPAGQAKKADWHIAADEVADALDADVLLYNGRMARPFDRSVIEMCRKRHRRTHALLVLVTAGGDADAAYRVARALQEFYESLTLFVSGYCKSAGTLVATAATELVIDDHGELGPLDVQMMKTDELWETSSGLTVMEALNVLESRAYQMLETGFVRIKTGSSGQITFRTASDVAVSLVNGLLDPIYRQIDPMHIGEAGRAMNVANDYGERLSGIAQNLQPGALTDLISLYSSHGFVIDRAEAAKYFVRVRPPTQYEAALADHLGDLSRAPVPEVPVRLFLSTELSPTDEGAEDGTAAEEDADTGSAHEVGRAEPNGAEAVEPIVRGAGDGGDDAAQS
jgi:Serine dehydrogenase proteinase